jgi:hypothetical protein
MAGLVFFRHVSYYRSLAMKGKTQREAASMAFIKSSGPPLQILTPAADKKGGKAGSL